MRNITPAVLRGFLVGLLLVAVSLPGLFALHGALGLGHPPLSGLILLGIAVTLTLVLANVVGAFMGESRSSVPLAALAGLGVGIVSCVVVAPLYGGIVVDSLSHEAMGLAWQERGALIQGTRDAVSGGARDTASDAWSAARQGRLREELARWQQETRTATTPQAQQDAAQRARATAAQLTNKGLPLLKSGAARLSAFGLLLWAILVPPFGAAYECRKARR